MLLFSVTVQALLVLLIVMW